MITPFFQGLGAGGGLIVAVGAQNAFVLSQSVRGAYYITVALICIFFDFVFISAGVGGFGAAVSQNPMLMKWVGRGGAAFLFYYGLKAFQSAVKGGTLEADAKVEQSFKAVIATTLAVTLLNPHFYLDTVILLGGVSSQFMGAGKVHFWAGAVSASALWFSCLSLGGRLLAPLFKKTVSWRILDSLVCAVMWSIAYSLITG